MLSQFSKYFSRYPQALHALLLRQIDLTLDAVRRDDVELPEQADDLAADLVDIFVRSDFVAESWQKSPGLMLELWRSGDLRQSYISDRYSRSLSERLLLVADEANLLRELRLFRRREMVRIVWRDLMRWADMRETTNDASGLADACIDGALSWLYADACKTWGVPMSLATGVAKEQRLVVLGMGKLGAGELNVSSDIDLMFAFPEQGETQGVARATENQTFFMRLGQRLIQALDKQTADGFVFRVDMRLRPYGQSGALALSFAAMEEYYQDQGREWERYAMIKARVVAGDQQAGARLLEALKPFVYRRYLDFSAIESLRSMKDMIAREVRRRGLDNDIKLGAGGIREVEFIAQAFQLIRGGRDPRLQERNLQKVLSVLADEKLLPAPHVADLDEAYVFLRNLEHAIQGLRDQQTQALPEQDLERLRVALSMGFATWDDLTAVLSRHRQNVSQHFADVVAPAQQSLPEQLTQDAGWSEFWMQELDAKESQQWLETNGYEDPAAVLKLVTDLQSSRRIMLMQTQGRERLDQFMPVLLAQMATRAGRPQTLQRILQLVESVARRTAYLVLLLENPQALGELIRLCDESPWIAEQLTQTPLLLDELLHTESLYRPLPLAELKAELRQQLLRVPREDLEQQMDVLRHFKKANSLRVAASELRGTLPLMKVSDSLTWIAEAILEQVLELAWDNLVERHGSPGGDNDHAMNFAIIGYGKLGGLELGHGSDLDLVFLHGSDPNLQTDGERPIDNGVFFTRLGQRIIHILTAHTVSGQLYEVDMRLRPSGNSGLLVSSLGAFRQYQEQSAWTWEHQALVRARVVAGDPAVGQVFDEIRQQALCRERDPEQLRGEVRDMRQRMLSSLGTAAKGDAANFDLKHDSGGIVDIEFMVQYAVLAWSHQYPRLAVWPDNIRILEELGNAGVLPQEVAERLIEIYKLFRARAHVLALQNLPGLVAADEFLAEREIVRQCWNRLLEVPAEAN